jgi:hypothetical protein
VVDFEQAKETLGSSGAIEAVCQMMRECTDAEEVLLTSTRVLSKVSVHETYRSQLLAGQVSQSPESPLATVSSPIT